MKLILFNGPPRSGKNTASDTVFEEFALRGLLILQKKLSQPIKDAFAATMSLDATTHILEFEHKKEQIIPELGYSYRQWQIDFSEKFMKPLYGRHIFARLLIDRIVKDTPDLVCVSDAGFQIEVDALSTYFGPENIALFSLYREGCNFTNDSREYVRPLRGMYHFPLINAGTKEKFENDIICLVNHWLEVSK